MNQIYSSRRIEKACKNDINFMWLLEGNKVPDHNTIARFRTKILKGSIEEFFNQFILMLEEQGEIDFTNVFIDGTKIEANANKYTFVWKKTILKYTENLKQKICNEFEKISKKYLDFEDIINNKDDIELKLSNTLMLLEDYKMKNNISFVFGKGRRKSDIQRFYENISDYLGRYKKYNRYLKILGERNSFSKSDIDATFMRMKEDHMRNGQLKAGYNVQIGVESEYITMIDAFSYRSDQPTLIPLVENSINNLLKRYDTLTADAGFESEANYMYLLENNIIAYIKPKNYESSKKKNSKSKYKRENMEYIIDEDYYICPNGKKLKYLRNYIREAANGCKCDITVYECENCNGCEEKAKCTRAKGNRQIHVSYNFIKLQEASLKRITSQEGIILRMNRSIQSEGVFGVIKQDYLFRRFLTRGKQNVKIELLLLALAYNVNKLSNKIAASRCGVKLFKTECN